MLTPAIITRIQVLHTEVDQLWHQAQRTASGATIHPLVNRISTARGALCMLEERQAWLAPDRVELLLALAEESLHDARRLIAQTTRGPTSRRRAACRTEHQECLPHP